MNNIEASIMSLTVSDDTNSAHVTTTSNHSNHTSLESNEIGDLAGREVNLDSVVDLDLWVRVADSIVPSVFELLRFFQPNIDPTSD